MGAAIALSQFISLAADAGLSVLDLYDAIKQHEAVLDPIFSAMRSEGRTSPTPAEWETIVAYDQNAKAGEVAGLAAGA